ncbi:hypothetical protein BDF21DRAFT_399247 [Thamnidium elegans]|nr:hypothetical protein BDF21DRAFT_399247 [Thamnidium elegans]
MNKYVFLFLVLFITFSSALPIQVTTIESEYRLPNVISQPLIKLLGETCYVSLLEEFHLTDVPCVKLAISKGLGLGIVVGGAIVKIPQIITIIRHGSAKGLSLTSFLLETTAYEIVLMYNTRQNNPFSTYGEVLFMTVQNILICLLIVNYESNNKKMIGIIILGFASGIFFLFMIPSWMMALLYAAQIPIGLARQLSVFAVLNYFAGTTARAFTTWTELDDPVMLGGNLLASVLNGILVFQLVIYWDTRTLPKAD